MMGEKSRCGQNLTIVDPLGPDVQTHTVEVRRCVVESEDSVGRVDVDVGL